MYEGIDTVVLFDELAYEDVMPAAWRPLPKPADATTLGSFAERNLRMLQAIVALEERGQIEKADEAHPHSADLLRLDTKINLLIDMVGQLLIANQVRPQPVPVRFNSLGASLPGATPVPAVGSPGVFECYLRDAIAEPLRIAGEISQVNPDGKVRIRFQSPGEQVGDLIKKIAFRRHRRQIADAKHPPRR